MIGRSKGWEGPSDFIREFNKKHNPGFYYGTYTKEKKTPKKKTDRKRDTTKRYPVFKVQD